MKSLFKFTLAALVPLLITGCGGGGDDDDSEATVRPKTLDGIALLLDGNVRFEFVRNKGTAPAVRTGEVESGSFFYSLGGVQRRTYPNQRGDNSDCRFPDSITNATYTYTAINETSGLLRMTGIGVNDLNDTGTFRAQNSSFCYFFNSDSDLNVNNVVEVDLTFSSSGNSVTTSTATARIPGSTRPEFDVVRLPAGVRLTDGGAVPKNYNPAVDLNRPSKLAPESLNNLQVIFVNGAGNTALDFTIDFIKESTQTSQNQATTEIGQGFMRVGGEALIGAVNYTWQRIGGTDSATLVITKVQSSTNPAANSLNGSYRLEFRGADNGSYNGTLDSNTSDLADVTGTFSLPRDK